VSTGSKGQVTGKVLTFNRNEDGKPYVRVQVVSGGPNGKWEWPDGWVLGIGSLEKTCRQCDQPYRTEERDSIFCPACDRLEHDGADSQRSARVALRGNATRGSQPQPKAGLPDMDDWERPF
jgi:hypothetical protein